MFCILGLPGSGKGVQSVKLQEQLGVYHIAPGVLLREIAKHNKEIGNIINKGHLVDNEFMGKIILEEIKKAKGKIFIIDGYPRTYDQATTLLNILKEGGAQCEIKKIIVLDCPQEIVLERLLKRKICPNCPRSFPIEADICYNCNITLHKRDDDTLEAINNRIDTAQKELPKILECFLNKIQVVNSHQPVEKVYDIIKGIIGANSK